MEDLEVAGRHVIPAAELVERFATSGGPGGQHANRSATRVVLTYDVDASDVFEGELRRRLIGALGTRLNNGVVTVDVAESRSQWRNRQLARKRLKNLLEEALRPPPHRRPTRPTRASRERRLEAKRMRGRIKRMRRKPDID